MTTECEKRADWRVRSSEGLWRWREEGRSVRVDGHAHVQRVHFAAHVFISRKTEGDDLRHSFILSLFLLYVWVRPNVPNSPPGGMFNELPLLSGLSWHQFRIHGLFHMVWFYMVQALEDVPFPTCLLTSYCLARCYNVSGATACDFPIPLALQSDSMFSVQVSEDDQFSLLVSRPPFESLTQSCASCRQSCRAFHQLVFAICGFTRSSCATWCFRTFRLFGFVVCGGVSCYFTRLAYPSAMCNEFQPDERQSQL